MVGRLEPGDTVYMAEGTYEEAVTLTDSGTADRPIVIRSAEGQEPVILGVTWKLKSASHLVLRDLTFRDCSAALYFGRDASANLVEGCKFLFCPPRGRENYERAILGSGPGAHRNRIEKNTFERPYEERGSDGARRR